MDSRSEYGNLLVSPSMRREWIEIFCPLDSQMVHSVSLHAEGVD